MRLRPAPVTVAERMLGLALALLAVTALAAVNDGAQPTQTPTTPRRLTDLGWSELRLGAAKLVLSAVTTIRLEQVDQANASKALRTPPTDGAVAPGDGPVTLLTVTTEMPFGRAETTRVWLDGTTAAALQTERVSTGRKPSTKVLRYTDVGAYSWRRSPLTSAEVPLGVAGWTKLRERYAPTIPTPPIGAVVTDPYALLPLIAAARLERQGASCKVLTISDDHLIELSFVAGRLLGYQAKLDESWPGGSRRRERQLVARSIQVSARPFAARSMSGDVDLGFLGLRGTVEILIEHSTGLPLELKGRASSIGELTISVERVVWREHPPQ